VEAMRVNVDDRRKAPRVKVDFDVRYRILRGQNFSDIDELTRRDVKADNISDYGIAIRTKDALEQGDMIQATFSIEGREMDVFCTVVWSDFDREKQDFEVGLEFDFIGQYDCIYIIQFIKKTMEGQG
jgi:hypothetical protein